MDRTKKIVAAGEGMSAVGEEAVAVNEPVVQEKKIKQRWGKARGYHSFKSNIPFYLMFLPAVAITLVFSYFPMVGVLLAFEDYSMFTGFFSPLADYAGFGNFVRIFSNPSIVRVIWNTVYLNVITLLINFPAPIIFALLLNEILNRPFKRTVQTISYLPYFLSWVSVTGMATSLLGDYGGINNVLVAFGGDRIRFLASEGLFIPLYIFLTVWKGVGWGSIIYLSSISSASPELYESAQLDGAGRFMQAWHITLPTLLPVTMIQLILNVGQVFNSNFDLVYGLTEGSPVWTDFEVISTWIYNTGIVGNEFSLSTALNLFQSVIALILTLAVNKISAKVSSISMW